MHGRHRLRYRVVGRGSDTLLTFHGYGQDRRVWEVMEPSLGDHYTLYCFDLFYHGQSSWPSSEAPVSNGEWCTLITHFLDSLGIFRFSIMGYSMGGRFALSLAERMTARIDRIILLAPDGIRSSRWYQLSSTTQLGNYLLRFTVVRPAWFFGLIRLSEQLGMMRRSVLRFAIAHMDTRQKRYMVYRRWTGLRRIQPHRRQLIQRCNRHRVVVEIYLGQYDKIVKAKAVAHFRKKLKISHLKHLPCGHNALISSTARHFLVQQ